MTIMFCVIVSLLFLIIILSHLDPLFLTLCDNLSILLNFLLHFPSVSFPVPVFETSLWLLKLQSYKRYAAKLFFK